MSGLDTFGAAEVLTNATWFSRFAMSDRTWAAAISSHSWEGLRDMTDGAGVSDLLDKWSTRMTLTYLEPATGATPLSIAVADKLHKLTLVITEIARIQSAATSPPDEYHYAACPAEELETDISLLGECAGTLQTLIEAQPLSHSARAIDVVLYSVRRSDLKESQTIGSGTKFASDDPGVFQ
jgi:hypothetical protein